MEFEDVADELFAVRREDFTALRDERAKQARPDRELARRIGELRKPTVAAWLVNQVSRGFPEEIDALAELGTALRRAHEQLRGEELRRLSRERHEVVDRLGTRAQWLARKEGYPFSDTTSRQIADTFEAAVSDEQALEAVRAARLNAALTPGSPEQWLTAAVLPAPQKAPAPRDRPSKARSREERQAKPGKDSQVKARRKADQERKADRAAKARREAQAEARRKADEAAEAQADAERVLADAEQAAAEAAEVVADLQARLTEAKQEERDRKTDVTAARKELTAARRKADEAAKQAADLE